MNERNKHVDLFPSEYWDVVPGPDCFVDKNGNRKKVVVEKVIRGYNRISIVPDDFKIENYEADKYHR